MRHAGLFAIKVARGKNLDSPGLFDPARLERMQGPRGSLHRRSHRPLQPATINDERRAASPTTQPRHNRFRRWRLFLSQKR